MAVCLIGLGSNIGDRTAYLRDAVRLLGKLPETQLLRISSAASTPPAGGPTEQGDYLNAAALIETSLAPEVLLDQLQRLEGELGRERLVRWGARTIDLDLLLYDNLELEEPRLTLPHQRMAFRRFVLEPAAEIAPDMVYPINGWTITRLLENLDQPRRRIDLAPSATAKCAVDFGSQLLHTVQSLRGSETWHVTDAWPLQALAEAESNEHPSSPAEELAANVPTLAVVWQPEVTDHLRVLDRARRLPISGPVLWLPGISQEQAAQEVFAAMSAMR